MRYFANASYTNSIIFCYYLFCYLNITGRIVLWAWLYQNNSCETSSSFVLLYFLLYFFNAYLLHFLFLALLNRYGSRDLHHRELENNAVAIAVTNFNYNGNASAYIKVFSSDLSDLHIKTYTQLPYFVKISTKYDLWQPLWLT